MTDVVASYAFVPWIRRGMATAIDRVDGDGSTGPRATFPVDLQVDTGRGIRPAGITLGLHGPGEIIGLDPHVVIRTWPRADASDAETNYFPLAELADADLPWRYTPARAGSGDRLRPWLVLAVVRDDEIQRWQPSTGGALPVLAVTDPAALPPLSQSWAWAHAQVTGDKDLGPGELATYLAQTRRVIARLVSPRRLEPRTRYRACLVPAFERGRLAGLGQPVADDVDGLAPAWTASEARPLPVYHAWRFATGDAGDFESLVRLLAARPVPDTVGQRPIDVSQPGEGLGPATTRPLSLQGALMAPGLSPVPWPTTERAAFVAQLAALLDKPSELLGSTGAERVVAPPIYGSEHARRWDVSPVPGSRPPWLHTLALEPPWRVVAALGTSVVQAQQRSLMAAAWKDADRIRELNQQLRQAQLAREILERIWARHLVTASPHALLAMTAPVHAKIKASPITVRATIENSRASLALFEAQLRKVIRPRGPIARRTGRTTTAAPQLIARVATGDVILVRPLVEPLQLATTRAIVPAPREVAPGLRRTTDGQLETLVAVRAGSIGALPIATVTPGATFIPAEGTRTNHQPLPVKVDAAARSHAQAAFRAAATSLVHDLGRQIPTVSPGPDLAIAHLVERVQTALDPRSTIVAAIRSRLTIAPRLPWLPEDPIEPIMAAPEFPQPMYEPLRDLSQDWLLPGLADIPPNTITLLETNQAFVEAYLVGLSHEMARELRWNEFPTDMRATYFRQFWDVRGYVGAEDAEHLKDITQIHAWSRRSDLGSHTARRPPPGGKHLVLLMRGDLLRRYPNTIVYAVETILGSDHQRTLGTNEKHPVFRGTLAPDVTFFGFELTASDARGSEDRSKPQGWYFVLQEQPSEPRFGLDVPDDALYGAPVGAWNDLSWAHLAASAGALAAISYIDLDQALPDTRGLADPVATRWHADAGLGATGSRASDLAYATLQRPMRLAVHGSDMLRGLAP